MNLSPKKLSLHNTKKKTVTGKAFALLKINEEMLFKTHKELEQTIRQETQQKNRQRNWITGQPQERNEMAPKLDFTRNKKYTNEDNFLPS